MVRNPVGGETKQSTWIATARYGGPRDFQTLEYTPEWITVRR